MVPTWYAGKHDHRSLSLFLSQVSTAIEQVEMIIGRSADAEFLDVVRQLITIAMLRRTMECTMICKMRSTMRTTMQCIM